MKSPTKGFGQAGERVGEAARTVFAASTPTYTEGWGVAQEFKRLHDVAHFTALATQTAAKGWLDLAAAQKAALLRYELLLGGMLVLLCESDRHEGRGVAKSSALKLLA